jgi:hypothetical protein
MSLVSPAWSGLLEELQTHTFTAISLSAIAKASGNTSRPGATPPVSAEAAAADAAATAPPQPTPSPDDTPGSTSYLHRVAPCASWSDNTVGSGGYGPHIATSAFFHLPMLLGAQREAAAAAGSAEVSGGGLPAALPAPAGHARRRARRLRTGPSLDRRRLRQVALGAPSEPPLPGRQPPPPLDGLQPPPPQQPALLQGPQPAAPTPAALPPPDPRFASGDAIPVEVHIFDYYGQRVRYGRALPRYAAGIRSRQGWMAGHIGAQRAPAA